MWEMESVEMEAARFWARAFAPLKGEVRVSIMVLWFHDFVMTAWGW